MSNLGTITLALDDLICDRPPALSTAVAALPQHLRDQLAAASTDALAGLRAIGEEIGRRPRATPTRDHPEWVRLGVLHTLVSWVAGKGRTCLHAPSPRRPQPVYAAAWKPDLVVCAACAHLLRLREGSTADRTCDACGRVTGPGELIYPCAVVAGALTYTFGACADCRYWTEETGS